MTKYNLWFFSSLLIAFIVSLPIITVFLSFFQETGNYFTILKNTFLFDYIFNSLTIFKNERPELINVPSRSNNTALFFGCMNNIIN